MTIRFAPLDPDFVSAIRSGGPDANGLPAEQAVSDGKGFPCRSCLDTVPKGAGVLVLAARPFPDLQPYAECGPIFLCSETCEPWGGEGPPPILEESPDYLVKGYGHDDRIVYGTGLITPREEVEGYAAALLAREDIAFVDVRSARNNCFLTRATRAD